MIRLYMDEQVRSDVIRALRARGVDCLRAVDDNHGNTDDEIILARTTELGRTVYTYDNDFSVITHRWLDEGKTFAGVIHVRWKNISQGQELREAELLAVVMEPIDMENNLMRIPLR